MIASPTARWIHEGPHLAAGVELLNAEPVIPPAGRTDFVDRRLRKDVTSVMGPVFMLLDSQFEGIQGGIDATAEFIQEPFGYDEQGQRVGVLSATREDSKHIVRFGQLVVQAPDRRERVELVAIKPQSNPARAVNEFRATQHVNDMSNPEGRPRGFDHLGFYRDVAGGLTGTVTRYEHQVLTLDTLLWDERYAPSERQICAALGHCAVILGDLHSAGIIHGDAQAKNMAADNKGPRVVDLEFAQKPESTSSGLNPITALSMVQHDLRYVADDFERWPELVDEWFVEPYLSIVQSEESILPEMSVLSSKEIRGIFLDRT